ncbi:MAG: hypothetical protein GQ570_11215 [Helicobacteraceae bacterium]|nr:hypothetical protein [Helicobacteraceae bacterium]
MPKYKVQLKQGSRTIVNRIEAKSVQSVISFFETLSTMKVTEVLKIEYENDSLPPVDDMQYYPHVKAFITNDTSKKSMQIIVHNLKLTKDSKDLKDMCISHLEIDNLVIDSLSISVFKNQNI